MTSMPTPLIVKTPKTGHHIPVIGDHLVGSKMASIVAYLLDACDSVRPYKQLDMPSFDPAWKYEPFVRDGKSPVPDKIEIVHFRSDDHPKTEDGRPLIGKYEGFTRAAQLRKDDMVFGEVRTTVMGISINLNEVLRNSVNLTISDKYVSFRAIVWVQILLTVLHEKYHSFQEMCMRRAKEKVVFTKAHEHQAEHWANDSFIQLAKRLDMEIPPLDEMGWVGEQIAEVEAKFVHSKHEWMALQAIMLEESKSESKGLVTFRGTGNGDIDYCYGIKELALFQMTHLEEMNDHLDEWELESISPVIFTKDDPEKVAARKVKADEAANAESEKARIIEKAAEAAKRQAAAAEERKKEIETTISAAVNAWREGLYAKIRTLLGLESDAKCTMEQVSLMTDGKYESMKADIIDEVRLSFEETDEAIESPPEEVDAPPTNVDSPPVVEAPPVVETPPVDGPAVEEVVPMSGYEEDEAALARYNESSPEDVMMEGCDNVYEQSPDESVYHEEAIGTGGAHRTRTDANPKENPDAKERNIPVTMGRHGLNAQVPAICERLWKRIFTHVIEKGRFNISNEKVLDDTSCVGQPIQINDIDPTGEVIVSWAGKSPDQKIFKPAWPVNGQILGSLLPGGSIAYTIGINGGDGRIRKRTFKLGRIETIRNRNAILGWIWNDDMPQNAPFKKKCAFKISRSIDEPTAAPVYERGDA